MLWLLTSLLPALPAVFWMFSVFSLKLLLFYFHLSPHHLAPDIL